MILFKPFYNNLLYDKWWGTVIMSPASQAAHLRAVRSKWASRCMKFELGQLDFRPNSCRYRDLDGLTKSLLRISESRWYLRNENSSTSWDYK